MKVGEVFESPASDYRRVVRVVEMDGDFAKVKNIESGRRGRIHVNTLARWTLLHPGKVPEGEPPE